MLEATRGEGSMGDIAIDDVDLYHGRCMVPRKWNVVFVMIHGVLGVVLIYKCFLFFTFF